MADYQTGILSPLPVMSRYMTFNIIPGSDPANALKQLTSIIDGEHTVLGIGLSLANTLKHSIAGLRAFPAFTANHIDIPSTQTALWIWLRGTDRGELFHRSRDIELLLSDAFALDDVIDGAKFDVEAEIGRDLSGYEDGTENPDGDEANAAAIYQGSESGMAGSSYVAVQQWLHDIDLFQGMSVEEQDNTIGRHVSDNEEFDEAPESAHVKRSAQESFSPEAFMVRRSMPWVSEMSAGLMFIAFGHSFDAYEAVLRRMTGQEDGITDALFNFTHPVSGAYYWCPPMKNGSLDFTALGL